MDDLKSLYYRGCRVNNEEFRTLMNKLILSEDLAHVAAAGAFPGSVPQKPLTALTTLKSFFHMGWVPTQEGFRELMQRIIADEQHAAADSVKLQQELSQSLASPVSDVPGAWPSANVNGGIASANDNDGWGPSNDSGFWDTAGSALPGRENNNWGWYVKNESDSDAKDDGKGSEHGSWGDGPDEGFGGSGAASEPSQENPSDDGDSESSSTTQDDTPTSSTSAFQQDLEETITTMKQVIIDLPARLRDEVRQDFDKSHDSITNTIEGMDLELKWQYDEKSAELLRLQKQIEAMREQASKEKEQSQLEKLQSQREIITLCTTYREVQQRLTDSRIKDGESQQQIATLRSKDAESQQEIKNLRAQDVESRREIHRLLRIIRDEAPKTFRHEVMQDRFLDTMFRETADRRDTV